MAEPELLARTYHEIISGLVRDGHAPHYTELAAALNLSSEEARQALHELDGRGVPGFWVRSGTDLVESCAPFSNIPTQYRITVEGQQKWYGQWGFESLAVSWLYPGKQVQIDCPCLDCNEPIRVRMRDGEILEASPATIVGHVNVPFSRWGADMPRAWSLMNLFRSEEHVRNWSLYDPESADGTMPLRDYATLFATGMFRQRLEPDYVLRLPQLAVEWMTALAKLGKTGPFWQLRPS
jgi:hypothetical protein